MIQVTDCPWGEPQSTRLVQDGVLKVDCAGHGGYKLDRKRNAQIPEYMRKEDGWYEEDVDWCIVILGLNLEGAFSPEGQRQQALDTLKSYYPDAYEKLTGTILKEGESEARDAELFRQRLRGKYIVQSAWGDWHAKVPNGMVGVFAKLLQADPPPGKYFLVPLEEYKESKGGFIVDPNKHQEIEPIQ